MKIEKEDIEKLMEGYRPSWMGIIKNDGRFGIKMNGGIIMPSVLDIEIYNRMGDDDFYIFKESDFVNQSEYQESKLIILKTDKVLTENKMNPSTGRPFEIAIPKKTEIKVDDSSEILMMEANK